MILQVLDDGDAAAAFCLDTYAALLRQCTDPYVRSVLLQKLVGPTCGV